MCSINEKSGLHKWVIDENTLSQLYPLLYKDIEMGGKFTFPIDHRGKISKRTSVRKIHKSDGEKDSVQAPLGIVNYHTHPISCYLGEETIWGWPSGEDLRECVLFGLKGSVAHIVIAVEGTYVIQTTPCILDALIHLKDPVIELLEDPKTTSTIINKIITLYIQNIDDYSKDENENLEFQEYFSREYKNESIESFLTKLESELDMYIDDGTIGELLIKVMEDIIRGILIGFVEIYFRSSHRFRS
mgnify:CR=1 FL=1